MPAGHLELSDGDIKKLGYQVRCDLLNYDPVLVANNFQHKVEKVFSKEFILNCLFGKTKYYAIHFEFLGKNHIYNHSYELSMHQILKTKLHTLSLLRK